MREPDFLPVARTGRADRCALEDAVQLAQCGQGATVGNSHETWRPARCLALRLRGLCRLATAPQGRGLTPKVKWAWCGADQNNAPSPTRLRRADYRSINARKHRRFDRPLHRADDPQDRCAARGFEDMNYPTADATTLMGQAVMTAHDYLLHAKRDIDKVFSTDRYAASATCVRVHERCSLGLQHGDHGEDPRRRDRRNHHGHS